MLMTASSLIALAADALPPGLLNPQPIETPVDMYALGLTPIGVIVAGVALVIAVTAATLWLVKP